jgi:L,D-peptidoglycan transpeptidase YkuD (ErfK/YbiS/YcfS/YnhG family)
VLSAVVAILLILGGCAASARTFVAVPWFTAAVGNADQVVSVDGLGDDRAMLVAWQRSATGWRAALGPDNSLIGADGIGARPDDAVPVTPAGVFTLDSMFGTAPSPGVALPYQEIGPNDWWDVDSRSPAYNTHQVCAPKTCPFDESVSEQLTGYKYAVVMGVNPGRAPRGGAAYFMHLSSGGGSAGCVTLDEPRLLAVMRWLRPGAVIAIR